MAEAAGLAASVAGLIGLAGQVLQGRLFLRNFFNDIKDAPEDVLDLKEELDAFTDVALSTQTKLLNASKDGLLIESEDFTRTLKRCLQVVADIRRKFEKHTAALSKSKDGVKPWWARVKVAVRKEALGKYLRRLEWATRQLQILQNNFTHDLLLAQRKQIMTLIVQRHEVAAAISRFESLAIAVSSSVINEYSLEHYGRSENKLGETSHPMSLLTSEERSTHSSHCGITATEYPSTATHVPIASHSGQYAAPCTDVPRVDAPSPGSLTRSPKRMIKWKKIHGEAFDFLLVHIKVETHEGRQEVGSELDKSLATRSSSQGRSFQASLRVPFFTHKLIIGIQNVPHDGLGLKLRTRNIIPRDSPIFLACDNLDLPRVRALLESKAASPYDYYDKPRYGDCSLIDRVIEQVFNPEANAAKASDLIKYLLPLCIGNPHWLNHQRFNVKNYPAIHSSEVTWQASTIDVIRDILLHTEDNPFAQAGKISVGFFLDLSAASNPLQSFLLEQSYHPIHEFGSTEYVYVENDRIMLSDANKMQGMNEADYLYCFVIRGRPYWGSAEAMYGLLRAASRSRAPDVELCCRNRLSFLLQLECDISKPALVFNESVYITMAQFAVQSNVTRLLRESLIDAGWSQERVCDLFDEDQYYGVPELIDGEAHYVIQRENRKRFVLDLIEGRFLETSHDVQEAGLDLLALSIGSLAYIVQDIIREVDSVFMIKKLPGGWADGGDIRLVPGKDFDCWIWDSKLHEEVDMRKWLLDDDDNELEKSSSPQSNSKSDTTSEDDVSDEDWYSADKESGDDADEGNEKNEDNDQSEDSEPELRPTNVLDGWSLL